MEATATRLDEQAKRRPDFRGGHFVRLKDGQEWAFPIPRRTYLPDSGSEDGVKAAWNLGAEFEALVVAMSVDRIASMSDAKIAGCELRLWSHLLRLNYTIADDELPMLLEVAYHEDSDPALLQMREEIFAVVRGDRSAQKKAPAPGQS